MSLADGRAGPELAQHAHAALVAVGDCQVRWCVPDGNSVSSAWADGTAHMQVKQQLAHDTDIHTQLEMVAQLYLRYSPEVRTIEYSK